MMDTMIGTAATAAGLACRIAAPARSTADQGIAAVMAGGAEMIRGGFGSEMSGRKIAGRIVSWTGVTIVRKTGGWIIARIVWPTAAASFEGLIGPTTWRMTTANGAVTLLVQSNSTGGVVSSESSRPTIRDAPNGLSDRAGTNGHHRGERITL